LVPTISVQWPIQTVLVLCCQFQLSIVTSSNSFSSSFHCKQFQFSSSNRFIVQTVTGFSFQQFQFLVGSTSFSFQFKQLWFAVVLQAVSVSVFQFKQFSFQVIFITNSSVFGSSSSIVGLQQFKQFQFLVRFNKFQFSVLTVLVLQLFFKQFRCQLSVSVNNHCQLVSVVVGQC
jgi:hypothetical protein